MSVANLGRGPKTRPYGHIMQKIKDLRLLCATKVSAGRSQNGDEPFSSTLFVTSRHHNASERPT